jgi:hypothetical protein
MKDEGGRLLSYAGMKGSPWFKAFSIPLREARSSFDDWVCVPATHAPENLAHIKSHEAEFVFVDSNRAILYLPDTPDFLVNQYEATLLESSRLITLMAAIDAFAFRTAARSRSKMQRYTREGAQDDDGDDGGFLEFRMTVLEQQARLRDILQLAETVKSAAFADHARYMASALGAMGVGGVADRNREVLALLQSQLEGWSALTSEMDERSEARRERLMNLVLAFLAVFGSAQTYSAIWGNPWLEIGSADPATWSWVLGALVSAGSLMLFLLLYPRAIPKVVGRVRKRMARRRDSAGETGAARGDG